MIGSNEIGIIKIAECKYPKVNELFRPSKKYPEYIFDEISVERNMIYDAVREAFIEMQFDKERINKQDWNPLKDIVKPGMTVLVKPNMVMDSNHSGGGTDCLYTNPAVVAPVLDFVIKALDKSGKIIVGDAPVQECDFEKLICESGYKDLIAYYKNKGINIELVDFRGVISSVKDGIYYSSVQPKATGKVVDLGKESEFYSLEESLKKRLRITNYNPDKVCCHHVDDTNEYMISSYVLDADVILNMPKPKTHRIAGMTAALKNFVGVNVRKEYLPHHTIGDYKMGGDESNINGKILNCRSYCIDQKNRAQDAGKYFKSLFWLNGVRFFSRLMNGLSQYREGCWYGNRTISKTVVDVNKIVYYADKEGVIRDTPQRNILIVADMIVCGEGNGPLCPTPYKMGIIGLGSNPVCFDEVVAKFMGFEALKIPTIVEAKNTAGKKHELFNERESRKIKIYSNVEEYNVENIDNLKKDALYNLKPANGWIGHIENSQY